MYRPLFLALTLLSLLPSLGLAQSMPNKHVVFLVHGISGDRSHFGHTREALLHVLPKYDPGTRYVVKEVEYDTGNDQKDLETLSKEVFGVMASTWQHEEGSDGDRFSMVMHSEGGLLGSMVLLQSLKNIPGYGTADWIDHLDAFITLGTPFWGAKSATWAGEAKEQLHGLGLRVPLKFGLQELQQMSFGSDFIDGFRRALLDPENRVHMETIQKKVRMLNIAGTASTLDPIGPLVSGTPVIEDDGAVPLASARFNFLFVQSRKSGYEDGDRVGLEQWKPLDLAPFVVVDALHHSLLPELSPFYSLAQTPKAAIQDEFFPHPSFPYIWTFLLGDRSRVPPESKRIFQTFMLDVHVQVEAEGEFAPEDLKLEFFQLDGSPLDSASIGFSDWPILYSQTVRRSAKDLESFRYNLSGVFKKCNSVSTANLLLKVSGVGLKSRWVEVKLKRGYSSFVDLNLEGQEKHWLSSRHYPSPL